MGLNASKTVEKSLRSSEDFSAAGDSTYDACLDLAQHAFPGIRPYQLPHAASLLHAAALPAVPLIQRWVPSPPTQAQVDSALERIRTRSDGKGDEVSSLTRNEFREFAVDLFRDAVLAGAGGAVARGVPMGLAVIAGVGVVGKAGGLAVGRLMGLYAAGFSATVYFSLLT